MMSNNITSRKFTDWFFGEYSWQAKLMWFLAVAVLINVFNTNDTHLWTLLVEGSLNSVGILLIIGYLSELRYKFIKESRNN
jgi:hypothetical protein